MKSDWINCGGVKEIVFNIKKRRSYIENKIEEKITIENLSNDKIIVVSKTNKKQYYAVNPSHCFIEPKSKIQITLLFHSSYDNIINQDNLTGHKFKFEAYKIPSEMLNEINNNPKEIYEKIKQQMVSSDIIIKKNHIKIPVKINVDDSLIGESVQSSSINISQVNNSVEEKELKDRKNELEKLNFIYNDLECKEKEINNNYNFVQQSIPLKNNNEILNSSKGNHRIIPLPVVIIMCLFSCILGYILTK